MTSWGKRVWCRLGVALVLTQQLGIPPAQAQASAEAMAETPSKAPAPEPAEDSWAWLADAENGSETTRNRSDEADMQGPEQEPGLAATPPTSSGEPNKGGESVVGGKASETVDTIPVNALSEPSETVSVRDTPPDALEEIVVTAQRKTQSIYDVPASMSVFNRDFIEEEGVADLSDLADYSANTKIVGDSSSGQYVGIRGFAKQSGNSAFEQAVALLIDGVVYNENDYFVASLFDIERVEILRGPQGTFGGKNSTAGLVNITTREPSDEFEGFAEVQYGQAGRQRLHGGFGGPLVENGMNFRIAGVSDVRDGVMKNTTARAQQGVPDLTLSRDRIGGRLKIEFPDVWGSRVLLQYEDTVTQFSGTGLEIRDIDQSSADFLRQFDPELDIKAGNFRTSLDNPGYTERKVTKLVGQWSTEIADWKLDVFGASGKVDSVITGGDATPAPVSTFLFNQVKPQSSLEIVASSPPLFGGGIELTGGLFFLERKLDPYVNELDVDPVLLLAMIAADGDAGTTDQLQIPPDLPPVAVPGGLPDVPPLVTVPLPDLSTLLPISTPGGIPVSPSPPTLHEVTRMRFKQTATSQAAYGQLTWNVAEEWAVLGGVRVTNEKRVADWNRTFESQSSLLMQNLYGYREFTEHKEREELLWMPKITLRYKPFHNFSVHGHWAEGFRSGGFNADAGANVGLEYEPERSTEWAINAKMQLFDNSLRLNIGLFRMDLQDFQLLTVEPEQRTGVTVNAGSALSQGLEADFAWNPLQWLRTFGSLAYNDASFTDFKKGPCPSNAPSDEDGDGDPRCDLTGARLAFTPKWAATLGVKSGVSVARIPLIGANLGRWASTIFGGGLTLEYEGDQYVGAPGDELFHEGSFIRLSANVGLADLGTRWFFRVSAENLTNEAVSRAAGPISGTNNIVSLSEPPRSVFAHFAFKF